MVWSRIGQVCHDLSLNLTTAANDLPQVWRGHAAEACQEFLLAFAAAVNAMAGPCMYYSDKYIKAAEAAAQLFEALTGPVGELIDAVIIAAAAAAAGTGTIETIVGPIAGYSVTAFYAHKAYELCATVSQTYGRAKAAFQAIGGAIKARDAMDESGLARLPTYQSPLGR